MLRHPMSTWHNFRAAVADEWVTGSARYRVQLGRITRGAVAVGVASARAPSTTRITGSPAASSRPSRWCPARTIFRRGCTGGSTATKIVQRGLGVSAARTAFICCPTPWQELQMADVVEVVIHLRDVQFFVQGHLPTAGAAAGVRGLMYASDEVRIARLSPAPAPETPVAPPLVAWPQVAPPESCGVLDGLMVTARDRKN